MIVLRVSMRELRIFIEGSRLDAHLCLRVPGVELKHIDGGRISGSAFVCLFVLLRHLFGVWLMRWQCAQCVAEWIAEPI